MLGWRSLRNPLLCCQLPLFALALISENCAKLQNAFTLKQECAGGLPARKSGCQLIKLAGRLVLLAGRLVKLVVG